MLRGKPSSRKPSWRVVLPKALEDDLIVSSSGTRRPASTYSRTFGPELVVGSFMAARKMSPVAISGMPYFSINRDALGALTGPLGAEDD